MSAFEWQRDPIDLHHPEAHRYADWLGLFGIVEEVETGEKRMMEWLPIVFAVTLYTYMVLNRAVSIIETCIGCAKDPADLKAEIRPA